MGDRTTRKGWGKNYSEEVNSSTINPLSNNDKEIIKSPFKVQQDKPTSSTGFLLINNLYVKFFIFSFIKK